MNKKATESILVCVNHPDFSKELIAYGKRLSLEMNLPLQVVNIQPSANGYCARGHEIELFYQQCKEAGAELTILFDDDFADATAIRAKDGRQTGGNPAFQQRKRRAGYLCRSSSPLSPYSPDFYGFRIRENLSYLSQLPSEGFPKNLVCGISSDVLN